MFPVQRFALTQNPDKSVKVPPRGTFTDLSGLLKTSIGCNLVNKFYICQQIFLRIAKKILVFTQSIIEGELHRIKDIGS